MALWSSFESKVVIAFGATTLVVAALAISTWKVADDAAQAAQMMARTHRVLNNLARARGYSLQAELTTQNHRLTGNVDHLIERNEAMASREVSLEQIRNLTADSPEQQSRWKELREVIDQRIAISYQMERLRMRDGPEAANAFAASAPLKATRTRTYELLDEMDADARQRLMQRESEHTQARETLVLAGALLAATLTALLCATHLLIRRQLRAAEASRRALADSEESLATTLHSIGDAVLATDTQGCVTRMNPVAERLTGWQISHARGLPVEDVFRIIHEQTREPARIPVAKVLATGRSQALAEHTVLIARDGTEWPIADSAAPIHGAQGQLRGVVLVFRDVTAERKAERIIREQNAVLAADVRERTAQWHESESHLHSVISAVPALIAYVNAQQRYVYVNAQYRERFAPEREDIAGCSVREIMGEDRYAMASPLIDKVLSGEPQAYDWQPFPDVWQTIQYVPKRQADGAVAGYYVLGTDITERKRSEERIGTLNGELEQRVRELERVSRALRTLSAGNRTLLRAREEQDLLESMCRAIVTAGGYGMAVVWYRGDGPDQPLRPMAECNYPGGMQALRQLGLDLTDTALGRGLTSTAIRSGKVHLVRDMPSDAHHAPWHDRLAGLTSGLSCPLQVDGKVVGALSIYDPELDTFGYDEIRLLTETADDLAFGISTLRARAEQQRVQAAMHHMLRHDTLTGLPNAIEFTETLAAAVEGPSPSPEPLAALQFNIERLGDINEVLGYSHGDQILRDFGQRLRESVPEAVHVARLRGDEFAVLAPARDGAAAMELVARVEASLSRPFPIADIELDVSAKAGIALYPEHGSTAEELLRRVGKALAQAKARGLNQCLFDPSQRQDQTARLNMAGELRRAISGGQLRLFLQPKVEFASGRVCGAEALVRWQHPQRGLLAPGVFIGLAEQTGLIKPLTEWVIVAALDLLRAWQAQGHSIPVAINLSARNFRDDQLLDKYRRWQAERHVIPGLMEVEITESTVMDDAEYALRVLQSLRGAGIPLYVDDFGTGYSSLSYLQKLPVDYIKIDQSFVAAMPHNRDSAMIVRSTIDLVHDLGLKTVAEGVETREHWDLLANLGCDIAQGYFIAKPMPAEDFLQWAAGFQAPEPSLLSLWSGL
ncbi:MAG: EAL domain-containing protein [Burkholderiaceae bacterium]|nr:MAG: EAL domain-containing protein [Burkholderiaceae bacterium]